MRRHNHQQQQYNKQQDNNEHTNNNNDNNNSKTMSTSTNNHNTASAASAAAASAITDNIDNISVATSTASRTSQRSQLPIDPNAVDTLLTQELSGLSFQDRSAINEEIHGVRCIAPVETPDFVEKSLRELQIELLTKHNHIQQKQQQHKQTSQSTSSLTAYEQACLIPSSYVHTQDFQLRFLRYELFDISKTAKKIIDFLQQSVELFQTTAVIKRPIQLTDLGKDGLDCLRCGDYQPLPFRDRSGRRIVAMVNNFGLEHTIEARVSCIECLCAASVIIIP